MSKQTFSPIFFAITELNAMYPPFAGRQFTSLPLLAAQTKGGKTVFQISFFPRYNPAATDREIVFFLPGRDDHSYVFIGITTRKFYICVKRKIKEKLACSAGHYLKVCFNAYLRYIYIAAENPNFSNILSYGAGRSGPIA